MRARKGDRVRVVGILPNDPSPLPVGSEGTVTAVLNEATTLAQVCVDWDNGRSLMLLPNDPFVVIG
jgi:hypothetical protein